MGTKSDKTNKPQIPGKYLFTRVVRTIFVVCTNFICDTVAALILSSHITVKSDYLLYVGTLLRLLDSNLRVPTILERKACYVTFTPAVLLREFFQTIKKRNKAKEENDSLSR